MVGGPFDIHPVRIGYAVVFGAAALACFASVFRAQRVDEGDVRRGLVGLLVLSGTWAGAHVGRILVPTVTLKVTFYVLGLLAGFGTVFAWLYFCSAYAGRSYHRTPTVRRLAVLLYGGVLTVKVTNPLHRRYFATSFATDPFPHLVVNQLALHWVVTGLAYALSAVGFYLLFETLADVNYDTTVLGSLVLLTGLPVALDLVGYLNAAVVVELNYEPLGVAAFAVGVLYVAEETFLAVPRLGRHQLVDQIRQPVLFLDDDDRLLDANEAARRQFAGVENGLERPVAETIPALADPLAVDGSVVGIETGAGPGTTYCLVNVTPLTAGETVLGRSVVLTDVTDVETQRRELRRQNEQLDGFASALAHELRNTLGVVEGNLELVEQDIKGGETQTVTERVSKVSETAERMERVVGDLARVARLSKTVTDPSVLAFESVVRTAWQSTEAAAEGIGVDVITAGDGRIGAEKSRLSELVSNVGAVARRQNATRVTFALADGEIRITIEGDPFPVEDPDGIFEYGTATPDAQTGMPFANIQSLARALGWTVELSPDANNGIRLRVSGVTTGAE